MAYVSRPQDITEKKKFTGATGPGIAGAGVAGATPAPPSTSSGSFVGVRSYLGANQPGAQKLGTQVSGTIDKETTEATGAIGAGKTAFGTARTANEVEFDQGAINDLTSTGQLNEASTRQLSGTYGGPKTLGDVGARTDIDREVTEAQTKGGLVGSTGGRMELLRGMATKPQETGVTRLNSALLSSDPTTATNLRAAGQRATDLTGAVAGAETDVAAQAQQAAIKNAETKRRALEGVGSYLTQSDTDIDQRLTNVKAAQTAKDNAAKAYLSSLATGEVSADGAAAVGLTPEQATALQAAAASGNPTARANLASYYTPAAVDTLTKNNVITPAEAARLTALANIAGRSGYQSAPTDLSSSFNLYGANQALRAGAQTGTGTGTGVTTGTGTGVTAPRAPTTGTTAGVGADGAPGNDRDQTGGTGGIGLGGFGLGGISINEDGIAVANTTGLSDKVANTLGSILGGLLGLPGLGMIGSKVNASINSAAEAAAKGANIGMSDSNSSLNGSMNTPGSAATSGPTGTGGISANAGEAAAAAAAQAGFSDAAVGAAAQAAADAARSGASADAAAAAGRAAADAAAIEGGALTSGSDAAAMDAHDAAGLAAADAASASLDAGVAPSTGGGGGGGGDKIICTAMNDYYGLPYRENKVWILYSNKRLTPAHQRGYHKVFLPLVKYAYHSTKPGHNVLRQGLEWMAITRTADLQAELNNTNPRPVIRAIRKASETILRIIGTKKE